MFREVGKVIPGIREEMKRAAPQPAAAKAAKKGKGKRKCLVCRKRETNRIQTSI